jgi:Fic family protein
MLTKLPPENQVETARVLRKLSETHRNLAELKGVAKSIPNESIILDTLSLQEAKESSAIENIITTNDEIYQADYNLRSFPTAAAKEVYKYSSALKHGFNEVKKNGIISTNLILKIQEIIESNKAGFRKLPGTVLRNDHTGEVVYTPPQHPDEIRELMSNLELFINSDELYDADPLVKMAIIHHQFESIHPFYDGNGRTGRIINILYLIKCDLLSLPILYLSRYFIRNKNLYYERLQEQRKSGAWETWLLYILEGISLTARDTIALVEEIRKLMFEYKQLIRTKAPKIYSQDLLNNLFRHPYTKIEYVVADLQVTRITATRYLELLTGLGILKKIKIGRNNFYLNERLFLLLQKK